MIHSTMSIIICNKYKSVSEKMHKTQNHPIKRRQEQDKKIKFKSKKNLHVSPYDMRHV